ncbi:KIN1-like protein [Mya arenaria]|uniref:KIN1-like protein n=1 Tax=Mya arenaria TaxID=6604 RepID=A0ABY7FVG7_MYAAR|nr:KIN1-like protein [Mya arenaria]
MLIRLIAVYQNNFDLVAKLGGGNRRGEYYCDPMQPCQLAVSSNVIVTDSRLVDSEEDHSTADEWQEVEDMVQYIQAIALWDDKHAPGIARKTGKAACIGDLKMENILLDGPHKNIKVIDFGLSNTFSAKELMKTHCGSLEYAAPELIATNDLYGPEIDIWSLGIILYGMLIGKLPFSTHYTDQYRRQKLLVQIEKGLTENHFKELALHSLSKDLVDLLNKLIEPSVEFRLPLLETEVHPWVTGNGKVIFTPFQGLPRDKNVKSQAMDELAELLETPREQLEETVHESKCDDFSAMFNMLLDTKRVEKGLFDTDFTQKQEVRKEKHRKRHHHRDRAAARKEKEQQKAKQATPAILCPDIEVPSDHEEFHKTSHNSTNFDLMALCSAPTWLGGDRRKSRRRRNAAVPPPSPLANLDGSKEGLDTSAATGGHDHASLLSPTQASTQVSQLLRRNSSRRRTRRTTAPGSAGADPPSRSESLRRYHSRRKHSAGSAPHSPHSPPVAGNNPEIKIEEPKQSPTPLVKRPANLDGLKECYDKSKNSTKGLKRHQTLGPHTSFARRSPRHARFESDNTDGGDTVHSDSSNPCSTTNLHEVFSDGSQDMLSNPASKHASRTSFGSIEDREATVESKIAATDIRSIVRPKQIVLKSKVNGQVKRTDEPGNLQVPRNEEPFRATSVSPDVIIETMQPCTLANLSDDEKLERRMSCDIPKTDSEKRVVKEKCDHLRVDAQSDLQSSTELLGAASIKPVEPDIQLLHGASNGNARPVCDDHYARTSFVNANACKNLNDDICDGYGIFHEPLVADLYSKRERISLDDDRILMQDGHVCYGDSSDHNSSQENLIQNDRFRRHFKEHLVSDEVESVSAPILLSPRELGLNMTPRDSPADSMRMNSAMSASSRRSSSPSVRFVMPSTPIRQMFQTPIARIDSFHSDDFEIYTSDVDALVGPGTPSPSSNSTQTPTVPCFQYRRSKKRGLLSKGKRKHHLHDGVQRDGGVSFHLDKHRNDVRCADPLLSSGSEGGSDGQVPEGEKTSSASRARIFPMENADDQTDGKTKLNDKTKMISDLSVNQNSNTSRKHQNSNCKTQHWKASTETETKKSIWRRGFVHLLKKKKLTNCNLSGNNNNDTERHTRNRHNNHSSTNSTNANTRNGHARGTLRATPPNTLEIHAATVDVTWSQPKVVYNNVNKPSALESGPSSIGQTHSPSPSPTTKSKVFDFTIVPSDTAKHKPCLLSWKTCRECTFGEDPSNSEESDEHDSSRDRYPQTGRKVDDNDIRLAPLESTKMTSDEKQL